MEELWQISTADYERTEVKKGMKPLLHSFGGIGEQTLACTSWKKRSAADECCQEFPNIPERKFFEKVLDEMEIRCHPNA